MILVDPGRVIIGCGIISFIMFGMGIWLGYRQGFANGLATWRKSYRYMTPDDIAKHKGIINVMADKVG